MTLHVDADFPGGNIVVEAIDGDEVRLRQDLRDTTQAWFYWCFRVGGAAGRTVRFAFTASRALGVRGPGVSLDGGGSWAWLGSDSVRDNTFLYTFPAGVPEVRFSFAMPYQASHWRRFADGLRNRPLVVEDTLCVSRKGRPVERLRVGPARRPRHRVAITCRHHCCEMMANDALEGLVARLVEGADDDARWLRENVEFALVPFVDKDGVEDGDQGKSRHPRDHGRDYEGESLYPETRALREWLPAWGDGRLRVGIDLHCPWIAGVHNEVIYLVGSPDPETADRQRRFSALLEASARGPLPFRAADYLPYGTAWNTAANFGGGKGFSRWVRELPGVVLGTAIEIPYANAGGAEVNAESARGFGRDLLTALAAYLRGLPTA